MWDGWRLTRVRLLRWPSEQHARAECDRLNVPRLLVLEAGVPAPPCHDALEDWIRPPIHQADVDARVSALRRRTAERYGPQIEDDGTLRVGDQLVVLSPTETAILRSLIWASGGVVPREELAEVAAPDGAPLTDNALHLQIFRLRKRLVRVSLHIETAWGRGYLLKLEERP